MKTIPAIVIVTIMLLFMYVKAYVNQETQIIDNNRIENMCHSWQLEWDSETCVKARENAKAVQPTYY